MTNNFDRLKVEALEVKRLGERIGYGHLMALASALWRKELSDKYGEQMKRGAFIGVCDISIKQDTLDNIQGEIKMYDRLVEMVFGGDPV